MGRMTQKGTAFESQVVDYLNGRFGGGIERRAKFGTKDRGDIAGVCMHGKPMVIECKNHRKMELAEWIGEAEVERGNADAEYGVVVHKRRGIGSKNMGGTYVTMTLGTLADMICGGRDL